MCARACVYIGLGIVKYEHKQWIEIVFGTDLLIAYLGNLMLCNNGMEKEMAVSPSLL